MKNQDFEEINDMLGNVIGGTSEQGLFQFSFAEPDLDTILCKDICLYNCSGKGIITGSKVGTVGKI